MTEITAAAKAAKEANHSIQWGVMGLVGLALFKVPMLSIIGLVCAVLAITTGARSRLKLRAMGMPREAKRATIGMALGIIGAAILLVVLAAAVFVLVRNLEGAAGT